MGSIHHGVFFIFIFIFIHYMLSLTTFLKMNCFNAYLITPKFSNEFTVIINRTKANTFRLVQSRSRQQMLMQQQQQQTQKQAQKQASAPSHSQTATSLEHVVSPTPLRQSDGLLAEHNALLRPPHDDAQMPMSSLTPQPMLMMLFIVFTILLSL